MLILAVGCSQSDDLASELAVPGSEPSAIENPRANEISEGNMSESKLSAEQEKAFLEAVSQQQNVVINQLDIAEIKEADWPDGCLGLAGPDEFCTQMIVPGWAIAVTDGSQTWNYRTDLDMTQIKPEP